jgi:putative transposase
MRTAYKCRAYPDPEQTGVLNRTFGCVRVVWNRTLAWRRQRYQAEKTGMTFAQANAYLTAMKATEELAWLNQVSCVPLQQAIRHQQAAYAAFFAKRARYPRFKSRNGRQSAEYTRSGFRWRDGRLYLAKMDTPLAFTWSWPGIDPASIDPSTVTVSRDPCGHWYVSFAVDVPDPEQLPATGRVIGVDLGITNFAVTSGGSGSPIPVTWNAGPGTWPATSGGWPAVSAGPRTAPKPGPKSPAPTARSAPPAPTSSTRPPPAWSATTT